MNKIEDHLHAIGLTLPPPKAHVANYLGSKRSGELLFVSGRVSQLRGEVGSEISMLEAKEATQSALLDIFAIIREDIGDLEQIVSVDKLVGFARSSHTFTHQPKVIDSASDLLVILLENDGRHARTATGVAQLPFGASVQLELVLRLRGEVS